MDPILFSTDERFVAHRRYQGLYELYLQARNSFWLPEEVDLAEDKKDWAKLTPDEREFILKILAFFAASDGLVNENLAVRFYREVQCFEARSFYGFQIAMENIHAEVIVFDSHHDFDPRSHFPRVFRCMHS